MLGLSTRLVQHIEREPSLWEGGNLFTDLLCNVRLTVLSRNFCEGSSLIFYEEEPDQGASFGAPFMGPASLRKKYKCSNNLEGL